MSWQRDQTKLCEFCWHDDESHEKGPSQRTPKLAGPGKYLCGDCADCEKEAVTYAT